MGGVSGTAAIFSIAALSLERYLALGRPRDPFAGLIPSRAFVLSLSSWLYAFSLGSCPLLGLTSPYVPEGFLTSCSFDFLSEDWRDRRFVWIFFVASWCLPLGCVALSYTAILTAVVRSRRALSQACRRSELRVAKIALALVLLWVAAWTPYAVVALLGITGQRRALTPLSAMLPAVFCKTAAVLDPFLYGLSHPSFRKELGRLLPCLAPRPPPASLTLRAVAPRRHRSLASASSAPPSLPTPVGNSKQSAQLPHP